MIIEWSQHLFSYWGAWFPFDANAPYLSDTNQQPRHPVQTYLDSLDARGVDAGIIVQPEPYGQDHRLLLYALALEQVRLRAACLFLPGDPSAPDKLKQMVGAEPRIVAQRFHAFRGRKPYFASWLDSSVTGLWRCAGELGLTIELHISPEQGAAVNQVVERYPDYPVVIDHLGEPGLSSDTEYHQILALARYPNVLLKLSGLARIAQELSAARFGECVRLASAAFGPQRLVWGGGSPREVDMLLQGFSASERELVLGGNLARLLNWEPIHVNV